MSDVVDINTGGEVTESRLGVCPEKDCGRTAFADLVAALGKLSEPGKGGRARVPNRPDYSYMTLPDLLTEVRTVMAEHHIGVMHEVVTQPEGVVVTAILLHASGYQFRSPALTLRSGPGPQDVGSASTYGRRYTLASMVGLAGAEDDDAQHASRRPPPPQTSTPPAPPTPPVAGGVDTRGQLASPQSLKYMHTLFSKAGMTDEERHAYTADILHIPADHHSNELTQQQVSGVIEHLLARARAVDNPPPVDNY